MLLILLAALAPFAGAGGLYGIRSVETFNPFCTSCHLKDHQDYLDDGRRKREAVRTLSGWHLAGEKAGCISCHGEDGIAGMTRTTWLASKDLLKFIAGAYEQPSRVFHPILNNDCLKCHPEERILRLPDGAFHAIIDHAQLKDACVDCHSGHRAGGRKEKTFLVPAVAQPRCDACHKDLRQKVQVGRSSPPGREASRIALAGASPPKDP